MNFYYLYFFSLFCASQYFLASEEVIAFSEQLLEKYIREKKEVVRQKKDEEIEKYLYKNTLYKDMTLHGAIRSGSDEAVKDLLELGRDINSADCKGKTPLIVAVEEKNEKALGRLLALGASINSKDSDGNTALIRASKNGYTRIVELLLDAGASIRLVNKESFSALGEAIVNSNAKIVDRLVYEYLKKNEPIEFLGEAVRAGHIGVVRMLLSAGVPIDEKSYHNVTPVQEAVRCGHIAIAKLLINEGADIHTPDYYGDNLLHTASRVGLTSMVRMCLQEGYPLIDQADKRGFTPLHLAVKGGRVGIVKVLLAAGADPYQVDSKGCTPMSYAIGLQNSRLIKILSAFIRNRNSKKITTLNRSSVGSRADDRLCVTSSKEKIGSAFELYCNASNGKSLDVSSTHDFPSLPQSDKSIMRSSRVAKAAKSRFVAKRTVVSDFISWEQLRRARVEGSSEDNLILTVCSKGDKQRLKHLLRQDIGLNVADKRGITGLMAAAFRGHQDIVKMLLNKNVEVDYVNENGLTALILAAEMGHGEIVKMLLRQNASVNVKSKEGLTALSLACKKGHCHIVNLLVNAGAKIARGSLELAIESKNIDIVRTLLRAGARTDDGRSSYTPLLVASQIGFNQAVTLLLKSLSLNSNFLKSDHGSS